MKHANQLIINRCRMILPRDITIIRLAMGKGSE